MSAHDPSLFWGDSITSHYPALYRECCICGQGIEHGQDYQSARAGRIIFAHVTCRDGMDGNRGNTAS